MTAQEVYNGTVKLLDTKEQAHLAQLIVDGIQAVGTQVAHPDHFFNQAQIDRLQELMHRTQENIPTPREKLERDTLIETELLASAQRNAILADALGK